MRRTADSRQNAWVFGSAPLEVGLIREAPDGVNARQIRRIPPSNQGAEGASRHPQMAVKGVIAAPLFGIDSRKRLRSLAAGQHARSDPLRSERHGGAALAARAAPAARARRGG